MPIPNPAGGRGYTPPSAPRSTPSGFPSGGSSPGGFGGGKPSWTRDTGNYKRTQSAQNAKPFRGASGASSAGQIRRAPIQSRAPGTQAAKPPGGTSPAAQARGAAGTSPAAMAKGAGGAAALPAVAGAAKAPSTLGAAGSRLGPAGIAAGVGLLAGEGLRRSLVEQGREGFAYPSNTGALLATPARTAVDGLRGLGESYGDLLNGKGSGAIATGTPPGYTKPGAPEFTGGQMAGVRYRGFVRYREHHATFFPNGQDTDGYEWEFTGPIGGLTLGAPRAEGGFRSIAIKHAGGTTTLHNFPSSAWVTSASIKNLRRADGQPDTGGDPLGPPEPITPPAPVRPPTRQPRRPPTEDPTQDPTQAPPATEPPRPVEPRLPGEPAPPYRPPATEPPPTEQPPATEPPRPVLPGDPLELPPGTERDPEQDPKNDKPTQPKVPPIIPPVIRRSTTTTKTSTNGAGPPTGAQNAPPAPPLKVNQTAPPTCRGCGAVTSSKLDQLGAGQGVIINNIGAPTDISPLIALHGVTHANQTTMLTRLGAQLPGGIGGVLGLLDEFLRKAWEFTRLDKVLNALNTLLLVHNAMMLSRSLGSSLAELASQAVSLFGIKNEKGESIDVGQVLGNQFENFVKGIVGEAAYNQVTGTWQRASAILNSAAQIVWTIRSIGDSTGEILEWSAENLGKIGNALKAARVVGPNAFRWMPEKVTRQSAWDLKVQRARERIETLEDASSSLSSVVGEVQSIQDEFRELDEQKQRFDAAIKAATPKTREDNDAVKERATAATEASESPTLSVADRKRGGEV